MPGLTSAQLKRAWRKRRLLARLARIAALNGEDNHATLLGLPPELREMIYREALVDSDPLHLHEISPTHHKQPGLLRTCRQIRHEAIKIFETENYFATEVLNLHPINPHYGHWKYHKTCHNRLRFVVKHSGSRLSWSNLRGWLEDCFYGLVGELIGQGSHTLDIMVAFKAFELMRLLVGSRIAITWSEVEAVLLVWKRTITVVNPYIWEDNTG